MSVTWTSQTGNGSPITGCTVQKDNEAAITVGANTKSYTFTGLTNGTVYTFKVIAINAVGSSEVATAFATPKAPSHSGSGYVPPSGPSVSVYGNEGGKVNTGDDGTVIIIPDDSYEIAKITINGQEVEIPADGKLSGVKSSDKVVVTFEKIPVITAERFVDVEPNAWYYDNVDYAVRHGWFYGTSDITFSPDNTMTRGMLTTVLYHMAGSPDMEGETLSDPFADVDPEAYYATATYWAHLNGIVGGYGNNTFSPDDPITREQFVVILYRYSGTPTTTEMPNRFIDADKISDYAVDAMCWAVNQGIVAGRPGGILDPCENTTRAEVAAMLRKYVTLER